ncbi:MAG: response regulator [Blastocatellia bacterium]|nr:response regulator [Blastocatellia bacterium]
MTKPLPRRILFVDDEPAMTQLGKVVLERAGHSCSLATNGDEALRMLLEVPPDLVILDYMMPGMSGPEVFRHLRNDPPYAAIRDIPVLMLTAKSDNDTERRDLLESGLAAYLSKPFGHRELLNIIENTLITWEVQKQARQTLENTRGAYLGAIQVTLEAIAQNPYLKENTGLLQNCALALAHEYRMDPQETETLRLAAMLHDIGKVKLSDELINFSGRLDSVQVAEIRNHVEYGVAILQKIPQLQDVAALVACHHERIDGTGYPKGLTAEEIPLGARILAVIDAFEAMTSGRPYRSAMTKEEAIDHLRLESGTHFDADVVEYFIESLERSFSQG